ncbi:MAG: endonuclease/exonuclease/phosphatase family protein [Candidatus Tenebribacter davisii]|nr:endonuclease/exonuclease/phosphatase family protein [Candidatus Tenebribacter davisii]
MKRIVEVILLAILLTSCGTTTQPNPQSPQALSAVCNYLQEVTLSWNYDNGVVEGFLIQRKVEGEAFTTIDSVAAGTYEYLDSDVTVDQTYDYQVASIFAGSQYEWSDDVSVYVREGFQSLTFGTEATIDVVTWNIEHFPKNLDTTVNYVSQIMRGINADIYALQEIESNPYFEELIEKLNNEDPVNTWDGYRANTSGYSIDLAYIYKSDQVQLGNIYEIYQDDWYAFPRNPLILEFTFSGNDLIMINNHLKAGGDSDDEARRLEACNKLDTYISNNFPDDEVIVLGDLNDMLTDSQNNVFISFLNEEDEYVFTDMAIAEGSQIYWSYPFWPSHLDHILITNELFDEFELDNSDIQTLMIDTILDNGLNEYDDNISDHRPVGLKLEI